MYVYVRRGDTPLAPFFAADPSPRGIVEFSRLVPLELVNEAVSGTTESLHSRMYEV